ncbi:MAG TPA: AmmeMemoRadiSam system protein B, partial [Candidatus Krumholzibacteria bacterium]|nr:AmmeMemoRadiSam system protein B [Candidatus Krumholzibacteria bacterium]
NARELASTVDSLIGKRAAAGSPVRVMVVPHAGYAYSGAIAGRAFARLSSPPERAFIIGPSHVESFPYTSIFNGSAYRTPLGDVPVDQEAVYGLVTPNHRIKQSPSGHVLHDGGRGEHAIEVELPFLQRVASTTRVVPIIMGSQSWEACEALGNALRRVVDWSRDVIIASSDLSHFYDDERARELDGVFCDTLVTLDAAELHAGLESGACEACGGGPVVASLLASTALRGRACEVLARGNSGDVSGDYSSVVGYVSAALTGEPA